MPFNIGPGELILILIIALVLLGPARLPDVAQSLGKSLREFRKAASDISDAGKVDGSTEPTTAPMAPPTASPVMGVPVPPLTPEAQTAVPAPSSPVPPAPSGAVAPPATGATPEATIEPPTGADRDSTAG